MDLHPDPLNGTILPCMIPFPCSPGTWNTSPNDHDSPYISHPRENNPDSNLVRRRELAMEALRIIDADNVPVFQEVESRHSSQSLAGDFLEEMGYQLFTGRESDTWYMKRGYYEPHPPGNALQLCQYLHLSR